MSNQNDSKILELKKQIIDKKTKLNSIKKFSPITNCSIEIDGVRYNINTLNNKEQLIELLIKIDMYRIVLTDLSTYAENYKLCGYRVEDWITDVKSKLDVVTRKEEERKLQEMEQKLDMLLSNDKKIELEISSIAEALK